MCDFIFTPHLSSLVPEELASVLDDLFVRQQAVGLLLAQGEDLPQRDAEGPHVAGRGELTLQKVMEAGRQRQARSQMLKYAKKLERPPKNSASCRPLLLLTSRMLSQAIQRMGSTARPWMR